MDSKRKRVSRRTPASRFFARQGADKLRPASSPCLNDGRVVQSVSGAAEKY
ncbi:hypothetical protein A6764_05600 [Brevibacillus sp. WF146]|uniref:hypothetical protein n=1 Tax=Brevibacillus sp. WF146 TaxID=319501 RepID=UPI000B311C83|nr:hypothetical protein [Brevibacillus sp. WF146]UYZ14438.1 hypothetical protein A6764_05600 [Brevibacillus sp. WF146]